MFDIGKQSYRSDIILGERYRDDQTGIEGTATALYFFQFACERVLLEAVNVKDGNLQEYGFDVPRVTHVASGLTATTTRTGGPARDRGVRATIATRH